MNRSTTVFDIVECLDDSEKNVKLVVYLAGSAYLVHDILQDEHNVVYGLDYKSFCWLQS